MMKSLSVFAISIASYYLAGLFGLQLAIPPGFASAVWPASGVALALAILMSTKWVVLGTFTASFLLNLDTSSLNFSQFSYSSFLIPIEIGLGAACQLLVGYYLFKRLVGLESLIDVPHAILRFTVAIAPIGCLISASVGVGSLYFNAVINLDSLGFTWITWWVGDTIGVLLFTPMILVLLSQKKYLSSLRKLQVVFPSTLIFIFTWVLFLWSLDTRQKQIEDRVNDYADYFSQKIKERLTVSRNKLLAYQAYFQGSKDISFAEFNEFSAVLLGKDTVLSAVGWTEVVTDKHRSRVERYIKEQGYPEFEFKQPSNNGMITALQRDEYYPVLYIFPLKTNRRALGLDLASLPGRKELLLEVEKQGEGRATPPITLVQEQEQQRSTILYLPVWHHYPKNIKLRGYVSGVYRVSGILGKVIEEAETENLVLTIEDMTNEGSADLLIASDLAKNPLLNPIYRDMVFENRSYRLNFHPSGEFDLGSKDWISWLILVSGFIISALFQAFILMITGSVEYTRHVVRERTKQLTYAMEKAEQASEAKSMFLANMSHELRTPLNAIVGLINLCLKSELSIGQRQYLNQSKFASQTLMALINQSLDYAKIESGKLELEHSEFELANVFRKIYAIFSIQAKDKKIDFKLISKQPLPQYLQGDELRFEQVLLNLCSNAFKFTQQGSIQLTIDTKYNNETFFHLYISVKDSGIGIASDQQKHLFQSFRQADNTTTRKFGGTGLGLAISKELIELMGGSIELLSEEGKGSEFKVNVPFELSAHTGTFLLDDILTSEKVIEPPSQSPNSGENASLLATRVLLVEDIEINRMIATELLEGHGAEVVQACDGQDALNILDNDSAFDIVMMDIQMPVLDGYEATLAIRSNPKYKTLPVVAMTANAMKEDVERCVSVGMNGHIAKPIDEEQMLSTILSVLGRQ